MRKKRLFWQLFPSYMIITLLVLCAITWYATSSLRHFYYDQVTQDLLSRANLVSGLLDEHDPVLEPQVIDRLCKQLGKSSLTRITVVLKNGKVIADSDSDPEKMENHVNRPEIQQVLLGATGAQERYSHTLNEYQKYLAVAHKKNGEIAAVIRTSVSLDFINKALAALYLRLTLAGVIIAMAGALLSLIVSRRISKPLEEMKQIAEEFANGNLSYRLPVINSEEIGGLADALNRMAAQLDERLQTVIRQQKEQEAIFSSMVEGVLAVDREERIITLNDAFIRMFGIHIPDYAGRNLQEIVRNKDLLQFVSKVLSASLPIEGDIVIRHERDLFLHAQGTALFNTGGKKIGAMVAVNDVTRIQRLENLRKEFVANVSHELKTPITAIKGFVETLQDGAIEHPEDAQKFLSIIVKHADRLTAIIEDLLSLSRIEQAEEKEKIDLENGAIQSVILAAMELCEPKALEKEIPFITAIDSTLTTLINTPLLEQALVNLIDNAIKYSEPKSPIRIETEKTTDSVVIHIIDQGCGIEAEHTARIFERFYRIDKARSRKQGGTGLGLSIVKHIVQAHGGKVTVQSTPNKGSRFSVFLPKNN